MIPEVVFALGQTYSSIIRRNYDAQLYAQGKVLKCLLRYAASGQSQDRWRSTVMWTKPQVPGNTLSPFLYILDLLNITI